MSLADEKSRVVGFLGLVKLIRCLGLRPVTLVELGLRPVTLLELGLRPVTLLELGLRLVTLVARLLFSLSLADEKSRIDRMFNSSLSLAEEKSRSFML